MADFNNSMDWEKESLLDRDEPPVEVKSHLVDDFMWPEDKTHPLCIPSVVKHIFDFMPLKFVEKQQGVCKLWHEEAVKQIRKLKILVFYEEETIKYYTNQMVNTFSFPHTAFEFHINSSISHSAVMTEFYNLFGVTTKKLEFHQTTVDGEGLYGLLVNVVPNLESLFVRNFPRSFHNTENRTFPHLKELAFHLFSFTEPDSRAGLKELIRAAPNLERLCFHPTSSPERSPSKLMEIVLDIICSDVPFPWLSEIDMKMELTSSHLARFLKSYPFPLVKLEVSLRSNVKSSDFRAYLNRSSQTLKYLAIKFPTQYHTAPNCFATPRTIVERRLYEKFLQNLTYLRLDNYIGSIAFIAKLVNLQSLKLLGSNLDESLPNGFGGNAVKDHELRYFKADTKANSSNIFRLSICFPYLKILHVFGVDDDTLRAIYREMPFLTELVLTAGTFTDTGISGVSREVCLDMAETTTYINAHPERLRLDLYIGSLPNLKTLSIHSFDITDLSIILGVVCCPNITSLSLQSDDITDTGLRTIGNKMHQTLFFLDVSKCTGISEAGRFYVKEKLKGHNLILEQPRQSTLQALVNQKLHRFIVTIRGRSEREILRPHGYANFLIQDPERMPRAIRERMIQRRTELLYLQRHRDGGYRGPDDELLADQELGPGFQRQLLEAHNLAAMEIDAEMIQEYRIAEQIEAQRALQLAEEAHMRGGGPNLIAPHHRMFLDIPPNFFY